MGRDWYRLTAHELRDALRAGETTSREITESFLARIDAVDEKVKAYTDVWREHALTKADDADAALKRGEDRGPLAGVPMAIKDVICTTQGTTTCCSQILKDYRSPFDATVMKRLFSAGAVPLGKVNMDEFAMGSSTENSSVQVTRNPWNLKCVPGGSSGGSAAAVAADECAYSLGSDTGGSIRQPAALCGCLGMKPTYGRVSRFGLVAFASSLDQIGPFSKDAEDMALVLNAICGHDRHDSTSAAIAVPDFTKALRDDVTGLRVGLPKEFFTDALNAEMREKIEAAVKVLESRGAKIVEVSLPHSKYAIAVYYIICTAEASANLARFDGVRYGYRSPQAANTHDLYHLSKTDGFGPEVKRRIMLGTYVLSSGYYDAYYLKAQKVRTLIRRDYQQAFEQCDVIAGPTSPTAAFEVGAKTDDPLEMYLSDIYTISLNLAGMPGMSVPCGLTDAKLPAGLQLLGKPFDEETLLRTAYTYEKHRGFEMGAAPVA
ncbi:MAG TPA: Asp-tRNA(Asn)/Glu-tRNA(Gln) amidotransferase subunit GatA [Candidatus Hydrogenedentes bacterium]|nr:Asp-tRNA(Asn)/Glu-tRNA(Gln) amidotransferase subunit GatA [Candidatus Hydrogenedentota bacterium]HOS03573.1 Asp-tRNA(Asn)/Glu-tRNA(Gln) amidotransferase subunit GatA [Candidatus Hydrogenedentota bacterium]